MKNEWKKHKSWGMVGLSRIFYSGSRELFGSDVTNHTGIQLTLKHAQKQRDLGRDWTMGDDMICRIVLSPNQFAEMVFNMNVGDSVPCTIEYLQGEGYIEFMPEDSKLVKIETDRMEKDAEMMKRLKDSAKQLDRLIKDKKMPKAVGEAILTELCAVHDYLDASGSDFLRAQSKREIADMVAEAKTQVSDYVNHKIFSVGLEKLMHASEMTPELLDGKENSDEIARITTTDNFEVTE